MIVIHIQADRHFEDEKNNFDDNNNISSSLKNHDMLTSWVNIDIDIFQRFEV